jgi:hypothetical protein
MSDVRMSAEWKSLMVAYTADDINIGDWITLSSGDGVHHEFRGRRGQVEGWKTDERKNPLVRFPDMPGDKPVSIGLTNIVKVEPDVTQEEIDRLFGIKKDGELQADAEKLLAVSNATILRLEARVFRLEVEDKGEDKEQWRALVEAQNEVKLARAAALELEADYIERWGIRAHRKAFT